MMVRSWLNVQSMFSANENQLVQDLHFCWSKFSRFRVLDGSDEADCQNTILTFNSSITIVVLEPFSSQWPVVSVVLVAQLDLKQQVFAESNKVPQLN